jgi:hypothetical protein
VTTRERGERETTTKKGEHRRRADNAVVHRQSMYHVTDVEEYSDVSVFPPLSSLHLSTATTRSFLYFMLCHVPTI